MSKFRFALNIFAITIFTLTVTMVAQAQTRTWVSGVGDDLNPCSRTAPCKTYAGAISKTAKDGEISTLDPGGFGAVTITKSITINGGGGGQGYGSILASLVNGVTINITDAADVRKSVRLDGLNINGASTGLDGIRMVAGNTLHVSNTTIDGFTGDGIDLDFTVAHGNGNNFDRRKYPDSELRRQWHSHRRPGCSRQDQRHHLECLGNQVQYRHQFRERHAWHHQREHRREKHKSRPAGR